MLNNSRNNIEAYSSSASFFFLRFKGVFFKFPSAVPVEKLNDLNIITQGSKGVRGRGQDSVSRTNFNVEVERTIGFHFQAYQFCHLHLCHQSFLAYTLIFFYTLIKFFMISKRPSKQFMGVQSGLRLITAYAVLC